MRRALLVLAVISTSSQAAAGERLETLQFQGFVSQGFTYTDHNNFFGQSSDGGSWEFRELGFNASWQITPRTLVAGNVLSRRAGRTDTATLQLDYGVLDHRFVSNAERTWGIQAGRFKNPYGMFNETRDVPFSRPSILLPQSLYFDRTRALSRAADGLTIYHERRAGAHDVQYRAGFGYPQVNDPSVEAAAFGSDRQGRFSGRMSNLASMVYDYQAGTARFAITTGEVNGTYSPQGDPIGGGTLRLRPLILSGQYNLREWSWTAEYAIRDVRLAGFAFEDQRQIGESAYLQLTRRLGPRWDTFIRYDVLYLDRDDRHGTAYAASRGVPAHTRYAKDWTFGARWMPTTSWLVAAEWHHVDGTGWLPPLDNPPPTEWTRRWNMFLTSVSYRF